MKYHEQWKLQGYILEILFLLNKMFIKNYQIQLQRKKTKRSTSWWSYITDQSYIYIYIRRKQLIIITSIFTMISFTLRPKWCYNGTKSNHQPDLQHMRMTKWFLYEQMKEERLEGKTQIYPKMCSTRYQWDFSVLKTDLTDGEWRRFSKRGGWFGSTESSIIIKLQMCR